VTVILGLDPGGDGALTLLYPDRSITIHRLTGLTSKDVLDLMRFVSLEKPHGFLEKVHSMPQNSGKSMFSFGRAYERLIMALLATRIPYEDVIPQKWQQGVGMGRSYPTQTKRKQAATQIAQQLFPSVKIIQAVSDSVLIAEYGYRLTTRKR
jgi:hypothetical protein